MLMYKLYDCKLFSYRLTGVLEGIGEQKEKLNMSRLKDVVHRKILELQSAVR